MTIILFIASALSFILGLLVFIAAKGSVHEVEGLLFILISVVLFCAMAVVSAINRIGADLVRKNQYNNAVKSPEPAPEIVPFPPRDPDFNPQTEAATPKVVVERPEPSSPKVQSWVEEARDELRKSKP